MPIAPGTRLGPYEVTSALGAGGMGEVYKAKDTRLERTVALKVLSAGMAADPEFRARFEREAKTISQLNHPNICVLHDVGQHDGRDFLIMEYLEGQTLADRLEKGPLPFDQALKIGIEIADALDKAHRQGIVHRDLKPGNVMLTKAGAKLLDFGLAKPNSASGAGPETQLAASPGQQPLTARGTILGTFQYMAPEQLEGRDADARSDVWAFGCVLYEMLSGKRTFEGSSQASLIGAILRGDPPAVSSFAPTAPPMLDRIVRTCLAKDPDDRWQNVHDLASELKWVQETLAAAPAGAVRAPATPRQTVIRAAIIAGSVLAGAALASVWWAWQAPRPGAAINVRAVLPLPPEASIPIGTRRPVALSPDGRVLAYTAVKGGIPQIHVRPLDRFEDTAIGGTQGGESPFFSPGGDWIGFFVPAEGRLKRVALSGGAPEVIAEAPDVRGSSWGPDNSIVYTAQLDGGLLRIAAGGGKPEVLTKPNAERREKTHRYPDVLPNGKGVIFTIATHDITSFSDARIAVYDFATRETKILVEGGTDARYLAPGYLVYGRGGALMAVRFDADRLAVIGTPISVVDGVLTSSDYGWVGLAVSTNGVVAYVQGVQKLDVDQLTWLDRSGRSTPVGSPRYILTATLSPTADRAAVRVGGANDTLWIHDFQRGGTFSRLTFRGNVNGAIWTPNGRRIIYNIGNEIASIAADGSGDDQTVFKDEFTNIPASITPDEKTLICVTNRPGTGWDIWALSLQEGKARPVLATPFAETAAQLSPDGRWIAYTSNESGRTEVYVRPFPALGSRSQVSREGGANPRWSPSGREVYYRRGSELFVADVRISGTAFDSGEPRRVTTPQIRAGYDVAQDARLLVIQTSPPALPTSFNIVLGWMEELMRKVPK